MALVSGSYASVTRGVSEQVPHERRPGQHGEQTNMISDPVRGTARRHGSLCIDSTAFATYSSDYNSTIADIKNFKTFTFFSDGVEHALIARTAAKPAGSLAPVAFCLNKDIGAFIPVVSATSDAVLDSLVSGGVSALVNTGRFVFIAGHTIVPGAVNTAAWDTDANKRMVALWVRGGAYSRTFTATLKMASGATTVISYKTKASSYPGVLDTSSILYSDPEYQKKVNDATAAYNTAATQWIGEAAADIQPDNIAQKLLEAGNAAGVYGTRIGSHVVFNADQTIVEISIDDGGDGSLLRGVGAEIAMQEAVSTIHYVGKVVRVLPKNIDGSDSYYLKAYPRIDGTTGWAEVVWRECAGYEVKPTGVFVYGTVESGTLYLAGSAAKLTALTGLANPDFEPNKVGDSDSAPAPQFIGSKISYLGMFQERMIVGSGATVFMSRPGDYLNFFRTSVLTVQDNDPIELYALGAEDDEIIHGAIHDKSLFLFGRRKQYAIPGRSLITPKSNSIVPMSAFEDAVSAAPVQTGNLVFYSKPRNSTAARPSSSVYQLQIGVVADSPESFDVSQQLDKYLVGIPVEHAAVTAKPHTLFLRTSMNDYGVYVYRYIDAAAGTERLWDSWSQWKWDVALGECAGITEHNGGLIIFTLRSGLVGANKTLWLVADRYSLDSATSPRQYSDSLVPLASAISGEWINPTQATWPTAQIAFDDTVPEFLLGTTGDKVANLTEAYPTKLAALWVGLPMPACFQPTAPFMRDRNDRAILDGRLTFSRLEMSLVDSGGCKVVIRDPGGERTALNFTGRIVGYSTATIGQQPIVTTNVSAGVYRETRGACVCINAVTWLPLTVSAMSWRGQFFNNTRRV